MEYRKEDIETKGGGTRGRKLLVGSTRIGRIALLSSRLVARLATVVATTFVVGVVVVVAVVGVAPLVLVVCVVVVVVECFVVVVG